MLQKLKNRKQGFTIIEVLIVLAIAGLILLIVFLAVPALQRNSRNTARKNEVASILGALSETVNNSDGVLPTTSANPCTANTCLFMQNAKLSNYSIADVGYLIAPAAAGTANPNDTTKVLIVAGAKCGPVTQVVNGNNVTTNGSAVKGDSSRQVVALYTVEAGGSVAKTPVCTES